MSFFDIHKFAKHIPIEGTICYIGLGSNLNEPITQLICAAKLIDLIPNTQIIAFSSFYRSKPVGPQDQPDYINAVLQIATKQLPHELLTILEYIEAEQGRVNKANEERWGPRIIDLDILLYGDDVISDDQLTIPHKELSKRDFVLIPLEELDPFLTIPGVMPTPIQSLINKIDCTELEVVCKVTHTPLDPAEEENEESDDSEAGSSAPPKD